MNLYLRAAYVNIKKAERISTTSETVEGAREIPRRQRRQTLRPSESSSLSSSLKLVDMVAQVGEHEDEIGERVFMESAVYPMSKKILDSPAEKLFGHISKVTRNSGPELDGPSSWIPDLKNLFLSCAPVL